MTIDKEPDVANLAMWLSSCLAATGYTLIEWRVMKKFIDDYANDHDVAICFARLFKEGFK